MDGARRAFWLRSVLETTRLQLAANIQQADDEDSSWICYECRATVSMRVAWAAHRRRHEGPDEV
eukprot:1081311-Lingulodinium_polyedra.AAC.1